MIIGTAVFIVIFGIVIIWVLLKFKEMRHKIFSVFLILLILFGYFSFTTSISGKNVDLSTINGWGQAAGIYFSWIGNAFDNVKSITAYAVGANWSGSGNTTQPAAANTSMNITAPNISSSLNVSSIWNKLK